MKGKYTQKPQLSACHRKLLVSFQVRRLMNVDSNRYKSAIRCVSHGVSVVLIKKNVMGG